IDMHISPALSRILELALALSRELGHKQVEPPGSPEHAGFAGAGVGPLHLLAAVLSEPSCKASDHPSNRNTGACWGPRGFHPSATKPSSAYEILRDAGVTREAVIAAIKATESSDHA